jgi:multisubunit Na+/H+ antiporter MnhE subunit
MFRLIVDMERLINQMMSTLQPGTLWIAPGLVTKNDLRSQGGQP